MLARAVIKALAKKGFFLSWTFAMGLPSDACFARALWSDRSIGRLLSEAVYAEVERDVSK
jgi:hypothetical protein